MCFQQSQSVMDSGQVNTEDLYHIFDWHPLECVSHPYFFMFWHLSPLASVEKASFHLSLQACVHADSIFWLPREVDLLWDTSAPFLRTRKTFCFSSIHKNLGEAQPDLLPRHCSAVCSADHRWYEDHRFPASLGSPQSLGTYNLLCDPTKSLLELRRWHEMLLQRSIQPVFHCFFSGSFSASALNF